jgi:hypothetical protein
MKNYPWAFRWKATNFYLDVFDFTYKELPMFLGPKDKASNEPWVELDTLSEVKKTFNLVAAVTDRGAVGIMPNCRTHDWMDRFPNPPEFVIYKTLGDLKSCHLKAQFLSYSLFRGFPDRLKKKDRLDYANFLQEAIRRYVKNIPCWGHTEHQTKPKQLLELVTR